MNLPLRDAISPLFAGMPSVTWTEVARIRLQTLSFFFVAFLVSAVVILWLWNYLQKDFSRLPRLTYPKALGLITLWGLLFIVVLTMISGARELLTPGAWEKQGSTFVLKKPVPNDNTGWEEEMMRHREFQRARSWILRFKENHDGRFPTLEEFHEFIGPMGHHSWGLGQFYYRPPREDAKPTDIVLHFERQVMLVDGTGKNYSADKLREKLKAQAKETP
jgi:hypothetical protein